MISPHLPRNPLMAVQTLEGGLAATEAASTYSLSKRETGAARAGPRGSRPASRTVSQPPCALITLSNVNLPLEIL